MSRNETGAASSALPETLDLPRHLELDGRDSEVHVRRGLLGLLALVPLLALLGFVGQRPTTSAAETDEATLKVYAPTRVRGGLLYTTRLEVDAKRDLRRPRLVLDPGWFEGMQVNSITPDPVAQGSDDGRVVLALGPISAGRRSLTFIQFQVDPTNVGHRSQDVALRDGARQLLEVRRAITVFP